MERYIWVNPDRLEDTQKKVGLDFLVELSPYDVPKGITGTYSPGDGHFLIEFEYIDNEPPVVSETTHGVRVFQGKHSGKLLRLVIPIDTPPLDTAGAIRLRTNVLDAVGGMSSGKRSGRMNRRVTKKLLADRLDELTVDLVS